MTNLEWLRAVVERASRDGYSEAKATPARLSPALIDVVGEAHGCSDWACVIHPWGKPRERIGANGGCRCRRRLTEANAALDDAIRRERGANDAS